MCKFQNVPFALGFEVKHSKIFCIIFRACIIILSIGFKYLGRYLGLREIKLQENGESYVMLSYTHCILRLTLLGILNRDDSNGQDM